MQVKLLNDSQKNVRWGQDDQGKDEKIIRRRRGEEEVFGNETLRNIGVGNL